MKNIEMKDYSRIAAVFVAIPLLIGSAYLLSGRDLRHVEVVIANLGPSPMENVVVHVTGNQYSIGSIGIGASAITTVSPRGESHVEIAFSSTGKHHRLVVDCYFERGYSGRIAVEIQNDVIRKVVDNIKLGKAFGQGHAPKRRHAEPGVVADGSDLSRAVRGTARAISARG